MFGKFQIVLIDVLYKTCVSHIKQIKNFVLKEGGWWLISFIGT